MIDRGTFERTGDRMALRTLILCIALLAATTAAFAKIDPSFVWTTLETPHFLIHYHQGAEDVHARLVPRIKWEPKEKTRLGRYRGSLL